MHAFSILLEYARAHPESVAMRCTQRVTSYRKLTSRIERTTARLQGEWDIRPGNTVAYCGSGHQDAIVLYLALLRCGANLLIVPTGATRFAPLRSRTNMTLLLNDHGEPVPEAPGDMRTFPLHTIIATRCEYQVADMPEHFANYLVRVGSGGNDGEIDMESSDALFAKVRPRCDTVRIKAHQLFEDAVFAPSVLSALTGGGSVQID